MSGAGAGSGCAGCEGGCAHPEVARIAKHESSSNDFFFIVVLE
jgi:hypothetical protein